MTNHRQVIQNSRRWVVKIGSALLTNDGRGLDREALSRWVAQIAALKKRGYEVVIVSSGAVAAGMSKLGWKTRPKALHELQAAAAVGQASLVQAYEELFAHFRISVAQILLDHDDLSNRTRYLNARSTLKTLMSIGVIPIVNENDTVVTDEIRFGDNDTLGALVANLIEAETLCILTDQKGMFDSDPRKNALAKIIIERSALDDDLDAMAGGGGALGQGGMTTKVRAARLASRSGTNTVIVGGRIDAVITKVAAGEMAGTLLYADEKPYTERKCWLASHMQTRGLLVLDDGAANMLLNEGKSLLPVGVRSVVGDFRRGDMVVCQDLSGQEIARGLANFASEDARKIAGHPSDAIRMLLGFLDDEEMIHRDNLVLT